MSTPAIVRPKRPLGVYLFTLTYSALATFVLIVDLSLLPSANATLYNENPWDTKQGPLTAIASLIVLASSIAAYRGSRIGRACLTASLGVLLLSLFAAFAWWQWQSHEVSDCSRSIICVVSEAWQSGPPIFWVTLASFYALHCWYFFGPRTQQFYS